MINEKRPLKVFICHAHNDKSKAREIYRYLRKRGIMPWLDAEEILPGQNWRVEIPRALETSDAIIICLSNASVDREGFIQKEIKFALDKALEMPEGRIFLIPARLEKCDVPRSLSGYQWVDLFDDDGYAKLMKSLKLQAAQLKRASVQTPKMDDFNLELALKTEKLAEPKLSVVTDEEKQKKTSRKLITEIIIAIISALFIIIAVLAGYLSPFFNAPIMPTLTLVAKTPEIHQTIMITPFPSSTKPKPSSTMSAVITSTPTLVAEKPITPCSNCIAFVLGKEENAEIYSFQVDNADYSKNLIQLTKNRAADYSPDWSFDNRYIVFESQRDGNPEIYTMNADGTNQTRLTNNSNDDKYPTWSPDGKHIVFVSSRDGNSEIYMMNKDGTNQTRLTNDQDDDEYPTWSPDGKKIAWVSSGLWTMNSDGSNPIELTRDDISVFYNPTWSSDGQKIAFSGMMQYSLYHDDFKLYVINADGTNQIRLSELPWVESPRWSPSGKKIAFIGYIDSISNMCMINIDGSGEACLPADSSKNPTWSPGGEHLAWISGDDMRSINSDGQNLADLLIIGGGISWLAWSH